MSNIIDLLETKKLQEWSINVPSHLTGYVYVVKRTWLPRTAHILDFVEEKWHLGISNNQSVGFLFVYA